jgi:hypothetical protein
VTRLGFYPFRRTGNAVPGAGQVVFEGLLHVKPAECARGGGKEILILFNKAKIMPSIRIAIKNILLKIQ